MATKPRRYTGEEWRLIRPPDAENTAVRAWYPLVPIAVPSALCPDLLRFEQIGEAVGWRGRVVRLFFWLMRAWRVP